MELRGRTIFLWAARLALVLLLVAGWGLRDAPRTAHAGASGQEDDGLSPEAAATAADKVRRIAETSAGGRSFDSIRMSEQEANSYLHYDLASSFPPGLSQVRVRFEPDRLLSSSLVDFDRWKEGLRTPPNPLVDFLLSGVHTVTVGGTVRGANGTAEFHLETVMLDDMTIPRPIVEFWIEHFLKPRYPGAAVDRPFSLPDSIDSVRVEAGSVVLIGKQG